MREGGREEGGGEEEEEEGARSFAQAPRGGSCVCLQTFTRRAPNGCRVRIHKLKGEFLQTEVWTRYCDDSQVLFMH